MKCENTKFFNDFAYLGLGAFDEFLLKDFQKFDQLLPYLGQATFLDKGSDGACFWDPSQEEGERVFKFGCWDDWRSEDSSFATNVRSACHLVERMEKLLETNEVCLPQVYRLIAFNDQFYFIEMEYLPFSASRSTSADQRLIRDIDQQSGYIFYNEEQLAAASPEWQEWLMSYERLQALGFSHRDFHLNNLRIDSQDRPKFIDLESFVYFVEVNGLD